LKSEKIILLKKRASENFGRFRGEDGERALALSRKVPCGVKENRIIEMLKTAECLKWAFGPRDGRGRRMGAWLQSVETLARLPSVTICDF